MNKITTIALLCAILTAGTIMVQAEPNVTEAPTITNMTASWHSPESGGVLDELDLSFRSTVQRQPINFVIDGKPSGSSYLFGKKTFDYSTGSLYFDIRLNHTVCVNGVCATLKGLAAN